MGLLKVYRTKRVVPSPSGELEELKPQPGKLKRSSTGSILVPEEDAKFPELQRTSTGSIVVPAPEEKSALLSRSIISVPDDSEEEPIVSFGDQSCTLREAQNSVLNGASKTPVAGSLPSMNSRPADEGLSTREHPEGLKVKATGGGIPKSLKRGRLEKHSCPAQPDASEPDPGFLERGPRRPGKFLQFIKSSIPLASRSNPDQINQANLEAPRSELAGECPWIAPSEATVQNPSPLKLKLVGGSKLPENASEFQKRKTGKSVGPSVAGHRSPVFRKLNAAPRVIDCSETKQPGVALVIKKQWCEKIFEGTKIWEIRGTALAKRTRICIAQSKSKSLIGEVDIVDCLQVGRMENGQLIPWSDSEWHQQNFIGAEENLPKHCIEDLSCIAYSKIYAWVLDNKQRYDKPKPYRHKTGCITWVRLDNSAARPVGTPARRRSAGADGRHAKRGWARTGRRSARSDRKGRTDQSERLVFPVTMRPSTSTEPAWISRSARLIEDDITDDEIEGV